MSKRAVGGSTQRKARRRSDGCTVLVIHLQLPSTLSRGHSLSGSPLLTHLTAGFWIHR